MELTTGTCLHGFTVKAEQTIEDCSGTLYEMIHDKTGAKLCWLSRNDENKTFSITFKTLPENDTGVFHILEHSCLNGSSKYPVKEPFVELLKYSMQTYLNALTGPDRTMYPVSSRNPKDFMNLMDIYLDAVLHPSIYTNPNIFRQEGWHYEIRDKEQEPVFKGVVLNEMKGAFSSVDESLIANLDRMLFPDNCYKYVSGGDPVHIPDLSYEEFLDTHRRFYHPSNARIFLDGDMDIDAVLERIGSYLEPYEKQDVDFTIAEQEVLPGTDYKYSYEISDSESIENKTVVCMAKIVSDCSDVVSNIAWNALTGALTANNDSPLLKPFLDRDLCEDVSFDIFTDIRQPWAVITFRNTEEDKLPEIKEVLKDTVSSLLVNGIDQEDLLAALNSMEFSYREKHEPAGIINMHNCMASWLYDEDPSLYLNRGYVYEELRNKIGTGYFEDLLKEFFFDEEHLQTLIAVPDTTLGAKRVEDEAARLHAAKASWGDEIETYIRENKELDLWQATEDTEEAKATLPRLSLEDVSVLPNPFHGEEKEVNHVPLLLYPEGDGGIVYLSLYFNLAGLTPEMLRSFSLFVSILTDLPSEDHSVLELQRLVHMHLGRLSVSAFSCSGFREPEKTMPLLAVNCSFLKQNKDKAAELILEYIRKPVFDKKTIKTLLKQIVQYNRDSLIESGNAFAAGRAAAHFSAEAVFRENVSGYTNALYMKDLLQNFDERFDSLKNDFEMFRDFLFTRSRMTVSVTGEENTDLAARIVSALEPGDAIRSKVHYPLLKGRKEAIVIPSGVSYTAVSGDSGMFDGGTSVLTHILNYGWLWSEIRVKGGAYGASMNFAVSGLYSGSSYRDPDPANTIRAIRSAGSYIKAIPEDESLDSYIIGAMAASSPLLSTAARIRMCNARYFADITYDQRAANRRKMLESTPDSLHELAKDLDKAMSDPAICIVAPKDMIDSLEDNELEVLPSLF